MVRNCCGEQMVRNCCRGAVGEELLVQSCFEELLWGADGGTAVGS